MIVPNPVTTDYIHAISGNPVGAIHELPLLKGLEYLLSNADLVSIINYQLSIIILWLEALAVLSKMPTT